MRKLFAKLLLIIIVILPPKFARDQSFLKEPQVPCTGKIYPVYPSANRPLAVYVWKQKQIPNWTPPPCIGWKKLKFDFVMASAGRFINKQNIEVIAERVVSFSTLTNILYWSVSNKKWQLLFDDASALANSDLKSRRKDFTEKNVQSGTTFYYFQDENTLLGPVVFRMTIHDRRPDRLVFSSVNVSPFQVALLDAVKAGRFEQYYIIEKEADHTWLYYSIVRSKMNHDFLTPTTLSSINRAVAYFRYVAGRPYKNNSL